MGDRVSQRTRERGQIDMGTNIMFQQHAPHFSKNFRLSVCLSTGNHCAHEKNHKSNAEISHGPKSTSSPGNAMFFPNCKGPTRSDPLQAPAWAVTQRMPSTKFRSQ